MSAQMMERRAEEKKGYPQLPVMQKDLREHQLQYNDEVADFFDVYNPYTNRPELYFGYFAGAFAAKKNSNVGDRSPKNFERIAVDFGCGTGWLTPRLVDLGFDKVYGIDTSTSMLRIALNKTAQEYKAQGIVKYYPKAPDEIKGKCSLVSAVHLHYHFSTVEELRNDFFGEMASLLKPEGQVVFVGCPSDYVHFTPAHYQNHIHVSQIPEDVRAKMSSPDIFSDEDGFVPLREIPRFPLKDGSQMKVGFKAYDAYGRKRETSLTDTFWSDKAIEDSAKHAGLRLCKRVDLSWRDHPHAYVIMHFRKDSKPNGLVPV